MFKKVPLKPLQKQIEVVNELDQNARILIQISLKARACPIKYASKMINTSFILHFTEIFTKVCLFIVMTFSFYLLFIITNEYNTLYLIVDFFLFFHLSSFICCLYLVLVYYLFIIILLSNKHCTTNATTQYP